VSDRAQGRYGCLVTVTVGGRDKTPIRGEQDFWEGEDYDPPERFDALLQAQLAASVRVAATGLAPSRPVALDAGLCYKPRSPIHLWHARRL
jgi:hypothetical protein